MRYFAISIFLISIVWAQSAVPVEVTGRGPDRASAIQNALREAVAQVLGTRVLSETAVQNFQLIKDVILTRTEGYIRSSEVIQETPFPDRYEVRVRATVSLSPLESDARSLAQWLGGLRFMVIYDPRRVKTAQDTMLYEYACERMCEYLSREGYRYVEKRVFDRLKDEAVKIIGADTSSINYAQKLAFLADAEFFINIHNLIVREEQKAMNILSIKATIESKSYDNCTAEGLGTVVGEGDWQLSTNKLEAQRKAVDGAAYYAGEKNIYLALHYLFEWCRSGAPFELRFYGIDEDQMDQLMDRLLNDPDFGGQLEPVISAGYWRLNCTYKRTPYRMRTQIRSYARQVGLSLSTLLQYGRQISFGPEGTTLKEVRERARAEALIRRIK
ncbi:MAG TPA: hypothetical protein EYP58_01630 [bacterium (Candidatus Stahlbacteria)]|nr:hypothetical protein [Candidatus Stahlbacteria bacterium]